MLDVSKFFKRHLFLFIFVCINSQYLNHLVPFVSFHIVTLEVHVFFSSSNSESFICNCSFHVCFHVYAELQVKYICSISLVLFFTANG